MVGDDIKFAQVRLIDADGNMIGVVPIEKAREMADEADLDLAFRLILIILFAG